MPKPAIAITTREITLTGPSETYTIAEGTTVEVGAVALKTGGSSVYISAGPNKPINVYVNRDAVRLVANCPGTERPTQVRKLGADAGSKAFGVALGTCCCGNTRSVKNSTIYPHKAITAN